MLRIAYMTGAAARLRILRDVSFHDAGYGYDELGLHPPLLASAVASTGWLYERYFRVRSTGVQNLPRGAAIIIANHAGILPVDGAMLSLDILRNSQPTRIPRPVADHFVPRLPMISTLFSRLGVVSGTRANVEYLLRHGELVIVFPEGVSGPAKPFSERYRIQNWNVGFAELAIRYGVPVLPVAILGAEESWPLIAKLGVHLFGAPYIPIPASPLPLPVHYEIRYGTPFALREPPSAADDPEVVAHAAAAACAALEQLIADARIARRGAFR